MKVFSSCLKTLAIISFWLVVWEVTTLVVGSSLIIVSPRVAFARLFALAQTVEFWRNIVTTMGRIAQGFGFAMVVGIFIAVLSAGLKFFHVLILPAINVLNAVPFASFAVLALFTMRAEQLSIFVPFVMVLPIIFHNTYKGFASTDPLLLEMADMFRVPFWKRVVFIYVKTAAPFVLAAAQVGIGFAWKSGIAAELIVQVRGTIGGSLHMARIHLQTADLFAWTIAIVILSFGMEKALGFVCGKAGVGDD